MLIGAFWTRIGSPTGLEESGTVEEVKWFLKNNKPVMLYFSKRPADLDEVDDDQLRKLKEFKKSIRDKGLQESYSSVDELHQKLFRQLTIIMRGVSVNTKVDTDTVKEASRSAGDVATKNTGAEREHKTPSGPKEEIKFYNYTDKSFIVTGNTISYKDKLKEAGGRWITLRGGGKAWNFSKKKLEVVASILGVPDRIEEDYDDLVLQS